MDRALTPARCAKGSAAGWFEMRTVSYGMRRFLIGLVAVSVAGCSQQPPTSASPPTSTLQPKGDSQQQTASSITGILEVVLKTSDSRTVIGATVVNLGAEEVAPLTPAESWSLEVTSQDGLEAKSPSEHPVPVNWMRWTIRTGQSLTFYIYLDSFLDASSHDDGWYECVFAWVNDGADAVSRVREDNDVSEIERVSFPPIKVHIVDGKATEWRPADDGWVASDSN